MAPPRAPQNSKHPADNLPKTWDASYIPFMNYLLASDLKSGTAHEVGRRQIKYYRPKDLLAWACKNWDEISKLFEKSDNIFKLNEKLSVNKKENEYPPEFDINNLRPIDFVPLFETLQRKRFIYRADKQEVKVGKKEEEPKEDTEEDQEKVTKVVRWPKKVLPYPIHSQEAYEFNLDNFYVVAYEEETSSRKTYIYLGIIMSFVLFFVMFPAWPQPMKRATAYTGVGMFSILAGISVIRLVLFMGLWYCGYDFWLFPNLFADDIPLLHLFRPTHSFKTRNDGISMYIVRATAFVMMVIAFFKLGDTHSLASIGEFATIQYLEFVEWGVDKIAGDGQEIALENKKNAFAIYDDLFEDDD